jgi:pyrimidine operon attenuation protein/uracil phosphoribosyltransferase
MQQILSHQEIQQKITRLGHQILENCFSEPKIFLGGICGNGFKLAEELKKIIQSESDQQVEVFEITVNKDEPWSEPIRLSISEKELKHGYILLVDDVLNSGKTMQYALLKLLGVPVRAIKTVALVDRRHRRYPIKCDYVGITLSTTLKNRVEIDFENDNYEAVLV